MNEIGTVPYGPEFFRLLQGYHALVMPSSVDEQPRLTFDAFSQEIHVIGSNTAGITSCVDHLQTGILFETVNVKSLASAVTKLSNDLDEPKRLGLNSLAAARQMTHQAMRDRRYALLKQFDAR